MDGKSTTAANLAVSLAAAGEPVILIDADLRRPVISTLFGLPDGAGLTDVIAGRASVDEVSHRIDENLLVIGAGRIPPNPSELLGSLRMRELVGHLSSSALVIIDTPPLLPVTDAAILATRADGALIVTSAGRTTYDMLQKALENLEKANARALGVVLNKVPRRGAAGGLLRRPVPVVPGEGESQDTAQRSRRARHRPSAARQRRCGRLVTRECSPGDSAGTA